jgi:hypothetical protein
MMATDEHRDFDPRFDPAFQRGFDAEGAATRLQAPRTAYESPVARVASVVQAPPVVTQMIAPPAQFEVGVPPLVEQTGIEQADATAESPPDRRPNPFLLALAVVSVALAGGGAWGVQAARSPFLESNAAAGTDFVGLQMLMLMSPLAIILGIATAVGIAFFYAAEWQRRR